MIQRVARVMTVLLLIVAVLVPPPLAIACGPDFTGPAFFSLTGPDVPYPDYARGRLELLQPTYWHEPLFIAYRNLSGKPFNNTELAALGSLTPSSEQAQTPQNSKEPQNWIATWESTRASVLGEKPRDLRISFDSAGVIRLSMRDQRFLQYYNCLSGAFENATRVLQSRVAEFGAQNPIIKEWIAAQDEVFENCSGDRSYPPKPKPAVVPAVARAEDPAVIRADRAYQIAAAHFYADDFDAAQQGFEEIANDASSPYRAIAPYLAARVLIREATLQSEEDEYDEALLAKAEARMNAVLANKESSEFHPAAQRLLGFIRIRLHRQERFHELETSLSTAGASRSFAQDLADYLWLLDRPVRTKTVTVAPASEGKPGQKGATVDESSRLQPGDMTDWIFTFHESEDTAYQHSLERWHETKSLAWLVSAIAKARAGDTAAVELSAAAEKIPADSPAFITVNFHRLRLLEQSGQSDATRRQLDQLLGQRTSSLSFSAKNQFLALRMKLAANLQEFLQFAPRFSNDAATYPNPPEAGATGCRSLRRRRERHPHRDASLAPSRRRC